MDYERIGADRFLKNPTPRQLESIFNRNPQAPSLKYLIWGHDVFYCSAWQRTHSQFATDLGIPPNEWTRCRSGFILRDELQGIISKKLPYTAFEKYELENSDPGVHYPERQSAAHRVGRLSTVASDMEPVEWDEQEHPRDEDGKFSKEPGSDPYQQGHEDKWIDDRKSTKGITNGLIDAYGQKFVDAVGNTPGARITPEGLHLEVSRYQKPEQAGEQSVRTGVFFLPEKNSPYSHSYKTKPGKFDSGYGGNDKIEDETVLKNPMVIEAGTGGNGPKRAYDSIMGKNAYEAMRSDVLRATIFKFPYGFRSSKEKEDQKNSVRDVLMKYGGDSNMAEYIMETSNGGNTLPYALQEHIVAHALREAGYDSILCYSKHKNQPHLSELFDLRATHYPSNEPHKSWQEVTNQASRSIRISPIARPLKRGWAHWAFEVEKFVEEEHPRAEDGKFVKKGNGVPAGGLDKKEAKAVFVYQSGGSDIINALSSGRDNWENEYIPSSIETPEDVKKAVEHLKAAISRSTLKQNMTLYRGFWDHEGVFKDDSLIGKEINSSSFMSTTKSPAIAKDRAEIAWMQNHPELEPPYGDDKAKEEYYGKASQEAWTMIVNAPEGTNALDVNEATTGGVNAFKHEEEVLMAPGTKTIVESIDRKNNQVRVRVFSPGDIPWSEEMTTAAYRITEKSDNLHRVLALVMHRRLKDLDTSLKKKIWANIHDKAFKMANGLEK